MGQARGASRAGGGRSPVGSTPTATAIATHSGNAGRSLGAQPASPVLGPDDVRIPLSGEQLRQSCDRKARRSVAVTAEHGPPGDEDVEDGLLDALHDGFVESVHLVPWNKLQ